MLLQPSPALEDQASTSLQMLREVERLQVEGVVVLPQMFGVPALLQIFHLLNLQAFAACIASCKQILLHVDQKQLQLL